MKFCHSCRAVVNLRMLICVVTGFSSGLPLFLLLSLLPVWLRSEGMDLATIGLFALTQLPYTWKFLWSPLLDSYALVPAMGRRRSWMLIGAVGVLGCIALFATIDPKNGVWPIALLSMLLALVSATYDIALDAYRRELLPDHELGLGNAVHVNAYRIASLVPGALALVLADYLPWSQVFVITALFMLPGVILAFVIQEPIMALSRPRTLRAAVVEPFTDFFERYKVATGLLLLMFLLLYKLGDSLATALVTVFYLDLGFSKTEIGLLAKNVGLWAFVIGAIAGGIWMVRLGINRALWIFGFLQMITILGFCLLASLGNAESTAMRLWVLGVVIAAEVFAAGLGTTALVAFMARTTNPAYAATQFALFSSLTSAPRTMVNASAGWLVENMGWMSFFILCFILALPGMLLLVWVAPWKDNSPVIVSDENTEKSIE